MSAPPGAAHPGRPALLPLSWLYGGAVALRGLMYDRGLLRAHRLPVPVLSVGNLAAGGTGKSPMVALIARMLAARGARPAIVSRGYGGRYPGQTLVVSEGGGALATAAAAGDEPVMLAGILEGVPIIVSRRRRIGGELAVSRFGAGCVILDDGFQHRALARSLDLLLLDGAEPFGNGHLLPAGLLREPVAAMRRAHAVVITRADRSSADTLKAVSGAAARSCPEAPIFHARTRAVALVSAAGGEVRPLADLAGASAVCFAGIARPERFFEDVRAAGAAVPAAIPFADHHRYTETDLSRVEEARRAVSADLVLTTEKDAARLAGSPGARVLPRLWALRTETTVDERDAFDLLIRRAAP